jgi:hypothetical protein
MVVGNSLISKTSIPHSSCWDASFLGFFHPVHRDELFLADTLALSAESGGFGALEMRKERNVILFVSLRTP